MAWTYKLKKRECQLEEELFRYCDETQTTDYRTVLGEDLPLKYPFKHTYSGSDRKFLIL